MNDTQQATQTLTTLNDLLQRGVITKAQVLSVLDKTSTIPEIQQNHINLQKILYYIGGFILLLGIIFYVAQFWSTMNQASRMIITLGAAIAAYSLGYYFYLSRSNKDLSQAISIVSVFLFPLGIATALNLLNISSNTSWGISINAALLFLLYFVSYYVMRMEIFLIFSFVAASTFFFSFTNFLTQSNTFSYHFTEYRVLLLGFSYLVFGYDFTKTPQKFMTDILYFFGLLMIFGAAFSLQGFKPEINSLWEVIYPFLLILGFYGSIKLQNKVFLILATVFTFIEIIKITYEYFSNSVGWPIALMIAGLLMMGVGYVSFTVNKRFLTLHQDKVK